ncbi:MAG: hypothetical protein R2873_21530 [Caldilineaceae bacterium]
MQKQPSSASSASSPLEVIALPTDYETPTITTYTEAELLNALGPAHAGVYDVDDILGELPMP